MTDEPEEEPKVGEIEEAEKPDGKANAAAVAAIQASAENALDMQLMPIIGTVLKGIVASGPGVPPDVLLKSIARVVGLVIASMIQADLGVAFRMRQEWIDNFGKGVRKNPPNPPPPMPQMRPLKPQ